MSYHILVASYPNDNGERHKLSDMPINRLGSLDVKKKNFYLVTSQKESPLNLKHNSIHSTSFL